MTDNTLIHFAGAVKTLEEEEARMKVGGYVILFGNPSVADLSSTKDYFTKSTDLGLDVAQKGRVRWQHGLDPAIGRTVLGLVDFKTEPDDVGQWAEGWIAKRTAYEKKIAGWVRDGKAGWSTGVPAHCVGRKATDGGTHEITEWCLGSDCSITLTPADPRQVGGVLSLKSFITPDESESPPEAPESAGFVGTLKRAESALGWADGKELTGAKLDALKSLMESMKRYRDRQIDDARLQAAYVRSEKLLTRFAKA